ncbi:MAG: hypothetical protein CfP315_0375 [Candidatus Improbicoccus pseudotrichonymphae]|uniref:Uncharacterized protein n=1 Tax=Candidatus Improbicoccus pseudotrichonymphae TaxID=3033792 RepID=A0AA48KYG3_9FIRM|nr:MAG: hypothetical protein CfP315_0375 [Candidatus Improbicoccus pseudotrichonymphae]
MATDSRIIALDKFITCIEESISSKKIDCKVIKIKEEIKKTIKCFKKTVRDKTCLDIGNIDLGNLNYFLELAANDDDIKEKMVAFMFIKNLGAYHCFPILIREALFYGKNSFEDKAIEDIIKNSGNFTNDSSQMEAISKKVIEKFPKFELNNKYVKYFSESMKYFAENCNKWNSEKQDKSCKEGECSELETQLRHRGEKLLEEMLKIKSEINKKIEYEKTNKPKEESKEESLICKKLSELSSLDIITEKNLLGKEFANGLKEFSEILKTKKGKNGRKARFNFLFLGSKRVKLGIRLEKAVQKILKNLQE